MNIWATIHVSAERAPILREVDAERDRQNEKHGPQLDMPIVSDADRRLIDHYEVLQRVNERRVADGTCTHVCYGLEEVSEMAHAETLAEMRAEAIQVAACMVKLVEAIDWQQKHQAHTVICDGLHFQDGRPVAYGLACSCGATWDHETSDTDTIKVVCPLCGAFKWLGPVTTP